RALVFAPDGQRVFYTVPPDPDDPAQAASLRAVNVGDGAAREIAVVPRGGDVQITASGELYIASGADLARVEIQPDGSGKVQPLPVAGRGRVSPDGRWVAYGAVGALDGSVIDAFVWEVATG